MNEHPQAPGEEARTAMEAVLKDQAEREVRRSRSHSPPVTRRRLLLGMLAALLSATTWILVAPPDALRPPPLPTPQPEVMTAGLRMDMYVAALQVEAYREVEGRLPTTLVEALEDPGDGEDLVYEIVGSGSFRITGHRGADRATYASTEDISDFLANALQVLENMRK